MTNNGSIALDGASSLRTGAVALDSNMGGSIVAVNSTVTLGPLDNTAGLFSLSTSSTATTGAFQNASGVNDIASTELTAGSTLTTGMFTNIGSNVTVSNGSTLATNIAGPFASFLTTNGAVAVGGANSLLDVGTVVQTGGTVHVGGGGRLDSLDYTNAGGSLSLLNSSSVAGTFTLDTGATVANPFALSILSGSFTLNGGANAIAHGMFRNLSTTSLQAASLVLTNASTNGGNITLETGSTFRTNQDGNRNSFTNTGAVGLSGASTLLTGDVTNTGGSFTATGGSTIDTLTFTTTIGAIALGSPATLLDTATYTQTGGNLHVGGGARADTLNFTLNDGIVSLLNASSVAGTDTLDTLVFTNNGGQLSVRGGATARLRGNLANNNASTGTIVVDGAGSLVKTRETTNQGAIQITDRGVFRTDENATFQALGNNGTVSLQGTNASLLTAALNNFGLIDTSQSSSINTNGSDFANMGATLAMHSSSSLTTRDIMNQSASISANSSTINARNVTNVVDHSVIALDLSTLNSTGKLDNSGVLDVVESTATFGVDLHLNRASGVIDVNTNGSMMLNTLENSGAVHIDTRGKIGLATFTNKTGTSLTVSGMPVVGPAFNAAAGVTNEVKATVLVANSANLNAGDFSNSGSVSITALGQLNATGMYTNNAGALTSVDGSMGAMRSKLNVTGAIVNTGILRATNGGIIDPPGYSGNGALQLLGGSIGHFGTVTFNTGGSLEIDSTSQLQIDNHLTNNLLVGSDWKAHGLVELTGAGGGQQNFEVAGYDFGNGMPALLPAFSDNFNIGDQANLLGKLKIDDNATVKLIDLFDNGKRGGVGTEIDVPNQLWTGSPTGSEALYVWNLEIGNNVTIDLNGLHLYYRAGNLTYDGGAPTVINGPSGDNRIAPIPVVPEPASVVLLGIGIVFCGCAVGRKRFGIHS